MNNVINLFDYSNQGSKCFGVKLNNKLIYLKSEDEFTRLKVYLKIKEMSREHIKYVTDLNDIGEGYFIFGGNLSDKQIETSNILTSYKRDLVCIKYDIDRVPTSQQTSTDVLELLFFSTESY